MDVEPLVKAPFIGGRGAEPPKNLVLTLHFKEHSLLPKGLILYCKVEVALLHDY